MIEETILFINIDEDEHYEADTQWKYSITIRTLSNDATNKYETPNETVRKTDVVTCPESALNFIRCVNKGISGIFFCKIQHANRPFSSCSIPSPFVVLLST